MALPSRTAAPRDKLAEMRPRNNTQMHAWVTGWSQRMRYQAGMLELSIADLRVALSKVKGLDRLQAAIRARRVAARFTRAQRLMEAAAEEIAKGMGTYLREYGELMPARKGGKAGSFDPTK